jgi:5-methylcytosine-specific restriction protein A
MKDYICIICGKDLLNSKKYYDHTKRNKSCFGSQVTYEEYKEITKKLEEYEKENADLKEKLELLQIIHEQEYVKSRDDPISHFFIQLLKNDPQALIVISEQLKTKDALSHDMISHIIDCIKVKRYIPEKVKKQIYLDQEYKCNICVKILPISSEIDHIIPLYQGGSNDIKNLQGLCSGCHASKTPKDYIDFFFKISCLYDKLA